MAGRHHEVVEHRLVVETGTHVRHELTYLRQALDDVRERQVLLVGGEEAGGAGEGDLLLGQPSGVLDRVVPYEPACRGVVAVGGKETVVGEEVEDEVGAVQHDGVGVEVGELVERPFPHGQFPEVAAGRAADGRTDRVACFEYLTVLQHREKAQRKGRIEVPEAVEERGGVVQEPVVRQKIHTAAVGHEATFLRHRPVPSEQHRSARTPLHRWGVGARPKQ
ncbi:hypothetical protein [Streptomyces sp. NPDC053560]|uniref:hypothetical protein n=1 Tax=Streptomyces sp. NPDC053560 TaxID=3365711 RepID=UPI0037D51A17